MLQILVPCARVENNWAMCPNNPGFWVLRRDQRVLLCKPSHRTCAVAIIETVLGARLQGVDTTPKPEDACHWPWSRPLSQTSELYIQPQRISDLNRGASDRESPALAWHKLFIVEGNSVSAKYLEIQGVILIPKERKSLVGVSKSSETVKTVYSKRIKSLSQEKKKIAHLYKYAVLGRGQVPSGLCRIMQLQLLLPMFNWIEHIEICSSVLAGSWCMLVQYGTSLMLDFLAPGPIIFWGHM